MANKKTIQKIRKSLKRGDFLEISTRSKLSAVTVSGFFNGGSDKMSDKTHELIITAALQIINERNEKELKVDEKVNNTIG